MTSSSMFRIMDRVMDFLMEMGPQVIKMPTTNNEKQYSEAQFKKISGVSGTLGCIDGTYIDVRTPAHKIKSTYTNRHDLPAITLQGICDHTRRFIDVFAGVPGKVHDSRVLKLSPISSELPDICSENNLNKYHLLGDGAYSIRPWLLTPYKDFGNMSDEEKYYNKKFSATRVLIENTFGILKGRFRQLIIDVHSVAKAKKFIICCCILHNLCIIHSDELEEEEIINENNDNEEQITDPVRETDYMLRKKGEEKRNFIKMSLNYNL